MTGRSQAEIRVQLKSGVTLFPQGAVVTEWQHRIAHLEAKGPDVSPLCMFEPFCHWLSSTPRQGVCYLSDNYRWGSSCQLRTVFQRMVHLCALRGWHKNWRMGATRLVRGSGWAAKTSGSVGEVSADWMIKEAAIFMETLKEWVLSPWSLMWQLVLWCIHAFIHSLMHSFSKYVLHACYVADTAPLSTEYTGEIGRCGPWP